MSLDFEKPEENLKSLHQKKKIFIAKQKTGVALTFGVFALAIEILCFMGTL
jgi:hypothetical protein